jgi:hypothetical protein
MFFGIFDFEKEIFIWDDSQDSLIMDLEISFSLLVIEDSFPQPKSKKPSAAVSRRRFIYISSLNNVS